MVKAGVNPKTAQSLARHSTIDLTMNVYTSLTVNDQASALNSLPAVPNLDKKHGRKKVPTMVPKMVPDGSHLIRPILHRIAPKSVKTKTPELPTKLEVPAF